jgi:hypothetical protein
MLSINADTHRFVYIRIAACTLSVLDSYVDTLRFGDRSGSDRCEAADFASQNPRSSLNRSEHVAVQRFAFLPDCRNGLAFDGVYDFAIRVVFSDYFIVPLVYVLYVHHFVPLQHAIDKRHDL